MSGFIIAGSLSTIIGWLLTPDDTEASKDRLADDRGRIWK